MDELLNQQERITGQAINTYYLRREERREREWEHALESYQKKGMDKNAIEIAKEKFNSEFNRREKDDEE